MRIILSLASILIAAAVSALLTTGGGLAASAPPAPQEPPPAFAWADACKDCHEAIYDGWANTKHARALDRLGDGDRRRECVRCHITGDKLVERRLRVVNAGIQCERCHGAAAAHAADPTVRTGLVKTPPESACRECHNEKSPHFKGFVYSAMSKFVHR
jgi:hypothetical protein